MRYFIPANTWIYRSMEVSPIEVAHSTTSWEQHLTSKMASYMDNEVNNHTTYDDPYYIFRLPRYAHPWVWIIVRKSQVHVTTMD